MTLPLVERGIPRWRSPEERAEETRRRRGEWKDYKTRLRERYEQLMGGQVWGGIQPQPRYRPAFFEAMGGLGGARPYLDWFESRFPSLVFEFESTLKTYKGFRGAGFAAREAGKIEESWADWLKGTQKRERERWFSLSPWQRGERPSLFAPRVATMSF